MVRIGSAIFGSRNYPTPWTQNKFFNSPAYPVPWQ
jgi:hypothetical protein